MADKKYCIVASMGTDWKVESRIRQHHLIIDQPTATDEGANPLEMFLFSLGGCLCSMAKMVAAEQQVEISAMTVELNATLDPAGLRGKSAVAPVGFKEISIKAEIDCPLELEEKKKLFELVCQRCPIHDNLVNTTVVTAEL